MSRSIATLGLLTSLLLASCTAPEEDRSPAGAKAPSAESPSATPGPSEIATQSAEPSESTASSAPAPHPVSISALMTKKYDGRGLRVGRALDRASSYTRYTARFKSGKLTISGIMNVPRGKGPFPVLVLLHGYIDPAIYTTGRGLKREQDYLARRGYVVLHVDYRNHAQSSDDPTADLKLRLGYTEDTINAVLAIKGSRLPYLNHERVGLLGRSMGGGVVYNVLAAQPGLVDAAVVFAPVSSNAVDNFNRWTRGDAGRRQLARRIIRAYGSPEEDPDFWRNASPVNFFDQVTEPLLIHHGTRDESCPINWSRTTLAALRAEGKDVSMFTYRGEQHAFGPQWPRSMRRTVAFFEKHLAA